MGSRPIIEARRKPFWLWRSAMSKRKNPRYITIVSVLTLAVFSAAHSSAAPPPSVVSGRERWFRWSSRSGLPPASLSAAAARSGWTRMKSVRSPWRTPVRVLSFYSLSVHPFLFGHDSDLVCVRYIAIKSVGGKFHLIFLLGKWLCFDWPYRLVLDLLSRSWKLQTDRL